ncbi:MAG: CBS domain-containing protein [Pirellulales bacterium]|nr:CBS domain-containing protein [Planctomycetales bacterium]
MNRSVDRLRTLRVCDVMSTHVVPLGDDESVTHAAGVLLDHEISGAPVVDTEGQVIGVVSSTDFVRCAHEQCDVSNLTVTDVMAAAVQTISQHASLLEAGRIMCGAHIHRLFVVDGQGHPVGVLTALDLVAATVQSIEEAFT